MQAQQNDVITPQQAGTLYGLFVERARRSPDRVAYANGQHIPTSILQKRIQYVEGMAQCEYTSPAVRGLNADFVQHTQGNANLKCPTTIISRSQSQHCRPLPRKNS